MTMSPLSFIFIYLLVFIAGFAMGATYRTIKSVQAYHEGYIDGITRSPFRGQEYSKG